MFSIERKIDNIYILGIQFNLIVTILTNLMSILTYNHAIYYSLEENLSISTQAITTRGWENA